MHKFARITIAAALLFFSCSVAFAQVPDAERQAREALAHRMANMTLAILKDQKTRVSDRQDNLQRSFARVMDIDWIAKFVLGNSWRTASDEQRERYTELYREYLTHVYVSTYAESSERKITDIKVIAVNDSDADDSHFTARTEVALSNADNLKVDYLVAARENGKYKIIDVVIEGVSLLSTHRAEFGKIAARGGVDSVIAKLEQKLGAEKTITLSMK